VDLEKLEEKEIHERMEIALQRKREIQKCWLQRQQQRVTVKIGYEDPTSRKRESFRVVIAMTFTWSGPRGVAGYPEAHALRVTVTPTGPLQILNSRQTFAVCRSIVITSVRFGRPSKQCRQDLSFEQPIPWCMNYRDTRMVVKGETGHRMNEGSYDYCRCSMMKAKGWICLWRGG
jgi:hypothetical protein